MSLFDRFVALDRWVIGQAPELPERTPARWLPVLPVLIPLLLATATAAVMHSSAVWLGALIGVTLAASLILTARESG